MNPRFLLFSIAALMAFVPAGRTIASPPTLSASRGQSDPVAVGASKIEVTVVGSVSTSGVISLPVGSHLDDALKVAIPSLDANLSAVVIASGSHKALANYLAYLDMKDLSGNPLLSDRDAVTVNHLQNISITVSVLGELKSPGRLTLHSGSTLLDVVNSAGGLTSDADRHKVTIRHENQVLRVPEDLDTAAASPEDATANVILNDGDSVTVGTVANPAEFTILGAVLHPGEYSMYAEVEPESQPGTKRLAESLQDAIDQAGGLADRPLLDKATIVRCDPAGKLQVLKVKDNAKISDSATLREVEIKPGDSITIPQGAPPQRFDPNQLIGIAVPMVVLGGRH